MTLQRSCEQCGTPFEPRRAWQKFCSRYCSTAAYWKRKLAEPPPEADILDAPLSGVTPAQQAEWDRRKDAVRKQEEEIRMQKSKELVKKVEERRLIDGLLEDLGYGSEGNKENKQ